MFAIEHGVASAAGRRPLNEDAVLVAPGLFVVADGMGGHAAGEVASAIAVERLGRLPQPLHVDAVLAAITAANEDMLVAGERDEQQAGMGTTVAGIALVEVAGSPHWLVFNVGDSRVYRYLDGALSQITVDHSEVEELVAAGTITHEEARTHQRRNVVTRSLGSRPAPAVDHWLYPARADEVYLICSDGLTLELADPEIEAILAEAQSAQRTAEVLVDLAVAAGGRDNVSVILVRPVTHTSSVEVDVTTTPRLARG